MFAAVGLLVVFVQPLPWLLVFILTVQGGVYLCAPIAALWNLRAQQVPADEFRRRHADRQVRRSRRKRSFVNIGFAGALFLAVVTGLTIAVAAAPHELTPVRPAPVPANSADAPTSQARTP